MAHKLSCAAAMIFLLATSSTTARGDTRVWDQPAFGVFGFGSSWQGGVAPGAADTANMGATLTTVNADVGVLFVESSQVQEINVVAGHYDWRFGNPGLTLGVAQFVRVGTGIGQIDPGLPDYAELTVAPSVPGADVGHIASRVLSIGEAGVRSGQVSISGAGTRWSTDVGVGNGGLTIRDGAELKSGFEFVGLIGNQGATGTATVSGAGSRWTHTAGQFWLGHIGGTAELRIDDGGEFALPDAVNGILIGNATPSNGGHGTLTVSGPGSIANIAATGSFGASTIEVTDGGTFNSGERCQLAITPGGTASLRVTGAGSSLTTSLMTLGGNIAEMGGTAAADVRDHGRLDVADRLHVWGSSSLLVDATSSAVVGDASDIAGAVHVGVGGTLSGDGTILADVINSGGLVAPGASPGALTIDGDFEQLPGGELRIELGGLIPGDEFDVLDILGSATLGGDLRVTALNGFVPSPGDTFDFLLADGFSGGFDSFIDETGFGLQLDFNSGFGTLTATVPEPASSLLLGLLVLASMPQVRGRSGRRIVG